MHSYLTMVYQHLNGIGISMAQSFSLASLKIRVQFVQKAVGGGPSPSLPPPSALGFTYLLPLATGLVWLQTLLLNTTVE